VDALRVIVFILALLIGLGLFAIAAIIIISFFVAVIGGIAAGFSSM
jgi:hypothetical protein